MRHCLKVGALRYAVVVLFAMAVAAGLVSCPPPPDPGPTPSGPTVTTLAGAHSVGSDDGTGTAALFYFPWGITTDGTNLFVADSGNNTIRKIVISTAEVTTLAGTAGSSGTDNGTGADARFKNPRGIAIDGAKTNLYVADTSNHRIRKIVIATAEVTTFAGSGFSALKDDIGIAAQFYSPHGITTDGTCLYVADMGNNAIRKIEISSANVTTLAGGAQGFVDGPGPLAKFYWPRGITNDGSNLFVADTFNNAIRVVVISSGIVGTLAGDPAGFIGNNDGTGTEARFSRLADITTDGTNLFVADSDNDRLRKVVISTYEVTTWAGNYRGYADGRGTAALFYTPYGITTDGTDFYVADSGNHTIRMVTE